MKFMYLAALAFVGTALAAPEPTGGSKTIPLGQPCKKDGSMGYCAEGFCLQDVNKPQGTCQKQ